MVHLVAGHTDKVASWVASHIPHVSDFGPCEAIAVMNGEYIIAGVVYHDYQPTCASIQLSMAAISPKMGTARNHRSIAWTIRLSRLSVLIEYGQQHLLRIQWRLKVNRKIGFTREAVLHSAFGKKRHSVIMRMLKPDYRPIVWSGAKMMKKLKRQILP
jgi:hypothetical protein